MATQFLASLLDTIRAARYLNLSPRTLEKRRCNGEGPPYIFISRRCVRYRQEDLDNWIASRVRTSTSDPGQAA